VKLRLFFIVLFLIGAGIGSYYLVDFISSYHISWPDVDSKFILLILLAIFVQLFAHYLRALKSKLLIDPIKKSDPSILFKGLSIGYLFNLLLPFRLGEFIRAFYIGNSLSVSKTTIFFSIIIERIVDGLMLGLCFAGASLLISPYSLEASSIMLGFSIAILLVTLLLATMVWILRSENNHFLRLIYNLTSVFNDDILNKMRLMAWSGIHGTKIMLLSRRRLVKYLLASVVMWITYFISVMLIAFAFFGNIGFSRLWYVIQSTYAGFTVPSGPGYLGTFQTITTKLLDLIGLPLASSFSFVDWLVLVGPISLVGVIVLVTQRFDSLSRKTNKEALINKLYRDSDISNEFSQFMASYFKGEKINQILSNAELENKFKLVRSFKGGSNAHTILVWQDGELRVKKITLPEYAEKLKSQADWLTERKELPHLPRVVDQYSDNNFYSFDLVYQEDYYPLFEFIHNNTTARNFGIIKNMLKFMDKSIYVDAKKVNGDKKLENYIETKILGKVNDTSLQSTKIRRLLEYKKIKINGTNYLNMLQVVEKIKKNKKAITDLSNYYETPIHGDLTVDNLIASSEGDFLVIDPNNENDVSSSVVDYGKLYQSLDSGYEFLIQLDKCTVKKNEVTFEDSMSRKYDELFKKVDSLLKQKLTDQQYKTIMFHEAVHYCRMLTYRANINRDTLPVFYATAVKLFNEFLDQYD
jgi:uncharacterized protein (TIRG00374 family)